MKSKESLNQGSRTKVFLICLAAAFIFWFFSRLSSSAVREVEVPVAYKNIPVSVKLIQPLPEKIKLLLEGKGFGFLSANIYDELQHPEIDLSFLRSAPVMTDTLNKKIPVIQIFEKLRQTPDNIIRINRTIPDSIELVYTGNYYKKITVLPDIVMNFRKQFMQNGDVVVRPDSIEISGPEAELSKINFIRTKSVTLRDIHHPVTFKAQLIVPGNNIGLSAKEAWVLIPASEFAEGTTLVPVKDFVYTAERVTLLPSRVKITYRAPLPVFKEIDASDFTAAVRQLPSGLQSSNHLTVDLVKIPRQATVVSYSPRWVEYYFVN